MKRQLYNISTVGMTCQRSKPARSLPSTGMLSLAVPGRVWLTVSRFSPASSIQSFFRCRNRLMLSKESPDLLHRDNNQRGRKHFTPERHPALSRSRHARLGEPATAEYRRHGDDWAPGGRTFSGARHRRCDHRWNLLDLYLPELWHHVTCGPSPRRKRFQGVWRDLFPCSLPCAARGHRSCQCRVTLCRSAIPVDGRRSEHCQRRSSLLSHLHRQRSIYFYFFCIGGILPRHSRYTNSDDHRFSNERDPFVTRLRPHLWQFRSAAPWSQRCRHRSEQRTACWSRDMPGRFFLFSFDDGIPGCEVAHLTSPAPTLVSHRQ